MIDRIMECFVNPVKSRLLLNIYQRQTATTKELAAVCPDIGQATLYRHLARMQQDGLIRVVQERRVRGATEKVYAIAFDFEEVGRQLLSEDAAKGYFLMFVQFSLALLEEFRAYSKYSGADPLRDGAGFSVAPVYATPEEIRSYMLGVGELLQPLLQNEPAPNRHMHSIATIVTPPKPADTPS